EVVLGISFPEDANAKILAGQPFDLLVLYEDRSNVYVGALQEIEKSVRRVVAATVLAFNVPKAFDATYSEVLHSIKEDALPVAEVVIVKNEIALSFVSSSALGLTIMFLMMSVVISTGSILAERQKGTWRRLLATSAGRAQILMGFLFGFLIIALLQFLVLGVSQSILFGTKWGNLYLVIPFAVIFLFTAVSMGLAVAGVVRTYQQQASLATIVMTASGMLAGLFIPKEILPPFMLVISKFMPQYWAMQGFTNVMLRGQGVSGILLPSLVLLLYATLFLSFGISRIRFE
ncbi:MAG: ABC transporter permease, partial [bacterium]|nr:ABC transporter permease [bacterium]